MKSILLGDNRIRDSYERSRLLYCPPLLLLAPLPIGFAVFLVHLAMIPITETGINPARSLGAAIVYNKSHAWNDQVWERELKTIEECKLGVSAAKRRQQMIGCLPKLFNIIRDIFRLSKCSVLTSQELVHKIISNDTDVIDRSEVEERLHLLRQLAPEWISGRKASSGDFLYSVTNNIDLPMLNKRFVSAS